LTLDFAVHSDVFVRNPKQIDSIINFDGVQYMLFGVVYFGGGHFVSRFVCRDPVTGAPCAKEYDGMKRPYSLPQHDMATRAECVTVDSKCEFPAYFQSVSLIHGIRVVAERTIQFAIYMKLDDL
jgi:hypothetical protein